MKIVWTDNFNRETVSDRLVCYVANVEEAQIMVEALQAASHGSDWYKLVEDSYELYVFDPSRRRA